MEDRIREYAKLLLECIKLNEKKYLVICGPSICNDFMNLLNEMSDDYNVKEVYIDSKDMYKRHDVLKNYDIEDIYKHPMFDECIYNKYAKLDAAFIFLESPIPNLMNDVDPEKIKLQRLHTRRTKQYFQDLYERMEVNWVIAGCPNEMWAKQIGISLDDMWNLILDICMVNDNYAYDNWLKYLDELNDRTNILNAYEFKTLKYTNSLGTDLTIELNDKNIWSSGTSKYGVIVNLPTYEIFTSPNWKKTEGVVYSSKPLLYNNILIDNFYLRFHEGRVIEYHADSELEMNTLKSIIEIDEQAHYLGECALVPYDSVISKSNTLFYETLYDENASCHLALGCGFTECLEGGDDMSDQELSDNGVNVSKQHVDFMIGTHDLSIIGITKDGKEIEIFKDGNFNI